MPHLRLFGRKKKGRFDKAEKKELGELIHQELSPFMTREQLEEYLERIRKDEKKLQVWNSLTTRRKLQLLKFVAEKEGGQHGKK